MRGVRKDQKFTIDENYSSIKTSLTSILILSNFVGGIYSTVVPSAFPQQNHDQTVGENMEMIGEIEADFLPILPLKFIPTLQKKSGDNPPYPLPSCTCSASSRPTQIESPQPLTVNEQRLSMNNAASSSNTSQLCPSEIRQVSSTIGHHQQKHVNIPVTTVIRAVPHQPRPLPSSAISPYSLSQSFSLQPLLQGSESLVLESSAVRTGHNRIHQNIVGTSSSYTSSSKKCSLEGVGYMTTNAKLLPPSTEQSGNGMLLLADQQQEKEQQEQTNSGLQEREKILNNAKILSGGVSLNSAPGDVQPEAIVISANSSLQGEDCPFCRSLDCEIIFALLFTLIVGLILLFILVFWLRGVFKYHNVFTRLWRSQENV